MSPDSQPVSPTLNFDIQSILGAAVFDFNGLPENYFISAKHQDISWVQTAFQALGLRSLLGSSLQLETFKYAVVHGQNHCAIVTKQHNGYMAALVDQAVFNNQRNTIINWMQTLHPDIYASTAHFIKA
ncbi:MAG: hypothetical protein AAGD25_14295 [Cyanobacteria bacterium P01_F01_bin.150]